MLRHGRQVTQEREAALAHAMQGVASELRLIEPADYVAFVRTEQFANLANLVNSSTELYYLPGTLSFGMSGDIELTWGSCPRVYLDMEFHYRSVNAYFRLMLDAEEAGVEMTFINFDGELRDPCDNTSLLIHAIEDARLKCRPLARQAFAAQGG